MITKNQLQIIVFWGALLVARGATLVICRSWQGVLIGWEDKGSYRDVNRR